MGEAKPSNVSYLLILTTLTSATASKDASRVSTSAIINASSSLSGPEQQRRLSFFLVTDVHVS